MTGPHDHIPNGGSIHTGVVNYNCGDRAVEISAPANFNTDQLCVGDFSLDKEVLSLLRRHCRIHGTVFEHEKLLCEEEFVELFNRTSGVGSFGDSEMPKAVICARLKTEIKARKWERFTKVALIGGLTCTALATCAAIAAL